MSDEELLRDELDDQTIEDLRKEDEQESDTEENKMGVVPVKKLIVMMSLPMMISMLVQALYNIVDSVFVAQIEERALTAVTLAFPMQNFMISVSAGTGVGINALLSRSLGEKRFDRANSAANNGIFVIVISAIVFALIGFFGSKPFIAGQTADPLIVQYGETYLGIVSCIALPLFLQVTFERLLQSTGRTVYSMISQLTGAVVNIILDPIMIFGYFGMPRLGVAGAAYATVIGQTIAACIGLFCNIRFNTDIKLSIRGILSPRLNIIKPIYMVGVPSILMMSIGSLMTYAMNKILGKFSDTATAVFGVYFKLQSFFFMPVFGLNNGLIPVLAYNYGARKKARIDEALRFSMSLAVGIMAIGTVIFEAIPSVLLRLFDASDNMLEIGVPAMRIICLSFVFAGASIAMGSVFQAFARSMNSLIVSIGRQLVVLIPVAWLLSLTGVVTNIWWAFPISEIASFVISLVLFRRLYRSVITAL